MPASNISVNYYSVATLPIYTHNRSLSSHADSDERYARGIVAEEAYARTHTHNHSQRRPVGRRGTTAVHTRTSSTPPLPPQPATRFHRFSASAARKTRPSATINCPESVLLSSHMRACAGARTYRLTCSFVRGEAPNREKGAGIDTQGQRKRRRPPVPASDIYTAIHANTHACKADCDAITGPEEK